MTTRVLYIAGSGRSGSTLLDTILAGVEGCVAVGELRYIWQRGMVENRLCGCGRHFADCPFWAEVVPKAGITSVTDAPRMVELSRRATRARHLPLMLLAHRGPDLLSRRLEDFPERTAALYEAVASVSGAEVVVDSSKLPTYGWLIDRVPGIDLRVVHLVRDPRATAWSWGRRKEQPDRGRPGFMERQGPAKSAALWDLWNTTTELFWARDPERYLRVRYEDFVASPRRTVERIAEFAGVGGRGVPFVADDTVQLRETHTVAGNPDRLRTGEITVRADREWEKSLPSGPRRLVTALTAPLLRRYGYRRALR